MTRSWSLPIKPEKWLFDKYIFVTTLKLPSSSKRIPLRELDENSPSVDGIVEVNNFDPSERILRATHLDHPSKKLQNQRVDCLFSSEKMGVDCLAEAIHLGFSAKNVHVEHNLVVTQV